MNDRHEPMHDRRGIVRSLMVILALSLGLVPALPVSAEDLGPLIERIQQEQRADDAEALQPLIDQAVIELDFAGVAQRLERDDALADHARLTRLVGPHLDEAQRARVLERLQQELLANEAALRRMSAGQFQQAILMSSDLHIESQGQFEALLRFVEHTRRLPEAASTELMFVVDFLQAAARDGDGELPQRALEGQARVLVVVLDRLEGLFDEERPDIERFQLVGLVRTAFDAGDQAQQRRIAAALGERLGEPTRAAGVLDGPVGNFLRMNLRGMGDVELSQTVLSAYVEGSERWIEADGHVLAALYAPLSPPRDADARAAGQRVLDAASSDLGRFMDFLGTLQTRNVAADPTLLAHLQRRLPVLIDTEPALTAQMLSQLAGFLAAGSEPDEVRGVLLEVLGAFLDGGGELVGEFAEFRAFAAIAVDFEIEDELRQLAVTPDGGVRQGVAKVLAWVHSDRESMHAWRAYLDDAIEQPDLTADERAKWLLARAYAAQVPPAELSAVVGRDWLERAFATAESESLRLEVLEQLIELHVERHDFDRAQGMLASVRHQFEGENIQDRLAALDEHVTQRRAEVLERRERITRQRQIRRIEAQIQAMQRRIEQAREQGRAQADIASLERVLEGFERDLEEARSDDTG